MLKGIDFVGVGICFFCHDGKGSFLMQKRGAKARDEYGKWDIGAGGLEVLDSVDETLKKEIQEEYCTQVLNYEFLGYRDVFRKIESGQSHWIALDFKVLVDPVPVKNGEPHKFDEVAWFKFSNLPQAELLHSQWPIFLEKYKNQL